jgi:hypothetical protein
VLEGVVAELRRLTDEERHRFLDFIKAEGEAADSSPAGRDYREFLLGDFPQLAGLREPP